MKQGEFEWCREVQGPKQFLEWVEDNLDYWVELDSDYEEFEKLDNQGAFDQVMFDQFDDQVEQEIIMLEQEIKDLDAKLSLKTKQESILTYV